LEVYANNIHVVALFYDKAGKVRSLAQFTSGYVGPGDTFTFRTSSVNRAAFDHYKVEIQPAE